jgi:hypothetical protein
VLGQNQVIDYWSNAKKRLAPENGGSGGESKNLLILITRLML